MNLTKRGHDLYMADKVLFWQSLVKLVDFHKDGWPFLSLLHTFFVIKMSWLFCCYVQFDIKALSNFHPITWLSP